MKRASVDLIQKAIDEFVRGIPTMERKQFDIVYATLKDLSLDSQGKIKSTISNLKIIGKVKNQLDSIVTSNKYVKKVANLKQVIGKISTLQTAYYESAFKEFTPIKLVPALEKISFQNTVAGLTDAGVNVNVVEKAADIVEQHIRDNASFSQLVEELRTEIVTSNKIDSKLVSYSKGIINDTLSNFSRSYHKEVTQDLDLNWFEYIGVLIDTSRPFCIAMVEKRYIHRSEFAKVLSQNSKAGLMPDTNASNLIDRCGGFNCNHQLVPVADVLVPKEIRNRIKAE